MHDLIRMVGWLPENRQCYPVSLDFVLISMHVFPLSGSLIVVTLVCGLTSATAQAKPANSTAPTAYQNGVAAFERGDLATARTAFQKAIKLNPRNADAQNMLGQVFLQQGEVDDAIVQFRTLVKLRPSLAIAHAYLAQALQAQSRLDEAITEFRIAVQFAPKQWQAHQALGRALSLQKKNEDAIAEFRQAILLAPQQPELHDELGSLLAQESKFPAAERSFKAQSQLRTSLSSSRDHTLNRR
jgi:Flp pilus assembly protein TadD